MSAYLIPNAKPHITIKDWFRNFHQHQKDYERILENSCNMKYEGHKLRDLSTIETQWNVKFTNDLLTRRMKEIMFWRNNIFECIQHIENELQCLTHEKELCSKYIENLYPLFTVINECNTLRNSRKRGDLCQDNVTIELNQEYQLLEKIKANLADKCEEACQQIIRLRTLLNKLQLDLELKNEAAEIEKETLELHDIPTSISHKPDISREIKYSSYQSWLESCKQLTSQTENELEISSSLRKNMHIPRENAHSFLLSQQEATNFAFRKRIYETNHVLDELQWERENLKTEKERITNEINQLEETHTAENEALKLIESQNMNRIYRANSELCQDESTNNLELQVYNLKNTIQKLNDQLQRSRGTYNIIDKQIDTTEKEIKKKNWSLILDKRCLEVRNELTLGLETRTELENHYSK